MRGEQTTQPRGWGATRITQEPARTQMCVLYAHSRVHGVTYIGTQPGTIACLGRVCAHSPHKRLPRPPPHICGCTRPCTSLPMCGHPAEDQLPLTFVSHSPSFQEAVPKDLPLCCLTSPASLGSAHISQPGLPTNEKLLPER